MSAVAEQEPPGAPEGMHGRAPRVLVSVLLLCAVVVAIVLAATGVPAMGAELRSTDGPAAILRGGEPARTHALTPGDTALWNVGETTHATTLGVLAEAVRRAGISASGGALVDVALRGCGARWDGGLCASGERRLLPATSVTRLTDGAIAGGGRAVAAGTWVQARVALAHGATSAAAGGMRIVASVGAASDLRGVGDSDLAANAVWDPFGALLLAIAAIGGGLAVAALVRRWGRARG